LLTATAQPINRRTPPPAAIPMIAPVLSIEELLELVEGVGVGSPVWPVFPPPPVDEGTVEDGVPAGVWHRSPVQAVGQLHLPVAGVPPFRHRFPAQNCPLYGKGHEQLN
jgi:hypothetical protein